MSYRRSKSDGLESSGWRLAHRRVLLECGVPQDVIDSDRRWIYVLLHGDDGLVTGWDPSWISAEQARRLLAAIEPQPGKKVGYGLVRGLRARCSQGA